ncbi:MAG: threonine synthase [Chloroflexi bacterium]|nr:threonine synthase [Chloroflexota bacterium]MDA1173117.1 threonine synthase [Chloroflexota bacterium]
MGEGVLKRYREYLPVTADTPMLTMGEGDTPLVESRRLGKEFGIGHLFFKLEGCNPTGSFKDRGMVVAVAKAMEAGHTTILCASTGNTSASAAAYGAAAGLETVVLVPAGQIAAGKLSQAVAYGARVIQIAGNFDAALDIAREVAENYDISLVNSVNPHRIEGQKTAAFEIIETLGAAPDNLFIPVGNAGNITAYWKGFKEAHDDERASSLPQMMGFQAEGAAPIVAGHPIADPQTIASAIRIGNPASWSSAITARDESGGLIGTVSDEEILEAYKLLARMEGVFCEPASAASVAGAIKSARAGMDLSSSTIACIITGHGLKDPSVAMGLADRPQEEAPADARTVADMLGARPKR